MGIRLIGTEIIFHTLSIRFKAQFMKAKRVDNRRPVRQKDSNRCRPFTLSRNRGKTVLPSSATGAGRSAVGWCLKAQGANNSYHKMTKGQLSMPSLYFEPKPRLELGTSSLRVKRSTN